MSDVTPREPKGAGPVWTEERRRSDEGPPPKAARPARQGLKGRPEASGKNLAFIGLGIMGAPMAANLVKAGFDVAGYNRSPDRIEQLVAAGGIVMGNQLARWFAVAPASASCSRALSRTASPAARSSPLAKEHLAGYR